MILDRDLAELYEVSTKVLNQAVKRNMERFPDDFMFQLTENEFAFLRSQIVTANFSDSKRRFLPYAFTEHGVTALAGILRSSKAVSVNIQIIRAFVATRKIISYQEHIFQRLDSIELKQLDYDNKFNTLFKAIESKFPEPSKGVFFEGEFFDAYVFVSNLIKNAKTSIILIDNYVDETVLTLFSKKKKAVNLAIYSKNVDKKLFLDVEKFSKQYGTVLLKKFEKSHDWFLIIDDIVYHFGASLKDLGKKWFAFSRLDKEGLKIIEKIS